MEFQSKKKFIIHDRIEHLEKEQNKSNINNINNNSEKIEPLKNNDFNDIKNEDKIKCSDCNLFFNSVELMSSHYYEIHEKHKISNNINKEKEKIEEEKKRIEELKKQEEEKKKLEEIKKRKEEKQKEEEIKKNDEIKGVEILKANKQSNQNNQYYYECYHDKMQFYNEKSYVKHFNQFHKGDFPFYCYICRRGFKSYYAIEEHNRAKGHYK